MGKFGDSMHDSPLFGKDAVSVDCGAFRGETVVDFIDALSRQKINGGKRL